MLNNIINRTINVAPLVGAWIEITGLTMNRKTGKSLLSWERGLKFYDRFDPEGQGMVAPLVGAWIEIIIARW